MSFWPPPPPPPSPMATTAMPVHHVTTVTATRSPKHELFDQLQSQSQSSAEQFRLPTYSSHTRVTYDSPLYPHAAPAPEQRDHDHESHQQQHDSDDSPMFEWHTRSHYTLHEPTAIARAMAMPTSLDPLPIATDTSASDLQRPTVSLEDEIFEARMLQEALRDCDATPSAPPTTYHQHESSNEVKLEDSQTSINNSISTNTSNQFQYHEQRHHLHDHIRQSSSQPQQPTPQSLFYSPYLSPHTFATATPPVVRSTSTVDGATRDVTSNIHVVSPVETLRSFLLHSHQQQQQPQVPMMATSPSSYASSSSSSSRSPVMAMAPHVPSMTPGSLLSINQHQPLPKKRVQQARICHVDGCTRGIRSRGLCKAHGGGRRCTTPGCTTSDQGGGHCVLHGGGRRCRIEGCLKSAQWRGVCKLHGGARRCRFGNCTKNGQVKQGYCRLHYNALLAQRQQQAQQDHQLSLQTQIQTHGRESEFKAIYDSSRGIDSMFGTEAAGPQRP